MTACSRSGSRTSASASRERGWKGASRSCTRSWMRERSYSSRTCGSRTNGFPPVAYRGSRCRFTWRIRGFGDSSATRSSTSKARRGQNACASCATRPDTRSSTGINCTDVANGRSSSGSPRPGTPSTTGPTRRASDTFNICGYGTRRATLTKTSPKHSRCGSGRGRTGDRVMQAGRRSRSFATSTR